MTISLPLNGAKITAALKNVHVSVPFVLAGIPELIRLWYPAWYASHQQAIQGTQKLLYTYGGLAAGVTSLSSQQSSQQTKDSLADLQKQVNTIRDTTMNTTKVG